MLKHEMVAKAWRETAAQQRKQAIMDAIAAVGLDELATAITTLKHRAGELGMLVTMHALEPATQAVGYELADKLTKSK